MDRGILDTLDEALDELLSLDADGLDDNALEALVVGLAKAGNRLDAITATLVQRWDRRGVWQRHGSKAAGARLARATGLRQQRANAIVRRGRRLTSMPHTAEAFSAGDLSADHVDLLASANRPWRDGDFAADEAMLVDLCFTPWFENAAKVVGRWKQHADQDAADLESETDFHARHASIGTGWRGRVHLDAEFDPIGGSAFAGELLRLCEMLRLQDEHDGRVRTVQQRRADALVEMAHRSRTAPADGLRPRPLITILIGDDEFARTCQTAAGTEVSTNLVVPLLTDAEIERIVYDPANRNIECSQRRTFTGALRRVIEVRDRHCQHESGCDVPASQCDVDHIIPYGEHPYTCLCTGELKCRYHNRIYKMRQDRRRQQLERRRLSCARLPFPTEIPVWAIPKRPTIARPDSPRPPPADG